MGNIVNIIIQLLSGGVGGFGAGKAMPKISLGKIGDIIAGILGGVGGSQLLGLLGLGGGAAGALDISSILTSILGGGVGGGALLAIVGAIKKAMGQK